MAYGNMDFSSFPLKYLQINTHHKKVKTHNHTPNKGSNISLLLEYEQNLCLLLSRDELNWLEKKRKSPFIFQVWDIWRKV